MLWMQFCVTTCSRCTMATQESALLLVDFIHGMYVPADIADCPVGAPPAMHDARPAHALIRVCAQRDNLFYPSYCFALPTLILQTPQAVLESVLWSSIVYWVAGLAPEAGRCGLTWKPAMRVLNNQQLTQRSLCLPATSAPGSGHASPCANLSLCCCSQIQSSRNFARRLRTTCGSRTVCEGQSRADCCCELRMCAGSSRFCCSCSSFTRWRSHYSAPSGPSLGTWSLPTRPRERPRPLSA